MNASQKAVSAQLRAILGNHLSAERASEAGPSLVFTAAAARPVAGPEAAEVEHAIRALEQAERANDSGPLARALLAITQAVV